MQRILALLAVVALAAANDVSVKTAKEKGTAMQKILQLLADMKAKSEAEIQEEKIQYTKFNQFCEQTSDIKTGDISEADEKIEGLLADIEKYTATIERLAEEIQDHMTSIEEATTQKKNATEIREQEAADYAVEHKDLSESVDALGRAIKQLKKRSDRAEDKANFSHAATNEEAQEDFDKDLPKLLRTKSWQRTMSLIQLSDSDSGRKVSAWAEDLAKSLDSEGLQQLPTPAKADNYEFQSGGIIDMLKNLQKQFIKEKRELEEEEFKKKAASEMLVGSLAIEIEKQNTAKSKKDGFKGSAEQNKAEAQASLEETKVDRAKDQEYLNDLQAECKMKTADFKERQRVRALEVEAVVKASDILKEVALVQSSSSASGTALASLRAKSFKPEEEKAIKFLQAKAKVLRSRTLDRFLQRVTVPHNSMAVMQSIAKMLHDMVTKLQEEGLAETEHKAWCDKEVSQNKATRSEKTEDADFAASEVDLLTTSVQTLTEENAQLTDEISKLEAAMEEATATRKNESATNERILSDSAKAHIAVKQAIAVLKDFYVTGDGAVATFLQRQKPEFAAGDYKDSGQSNVIRLLDVISQDLTDEKAETSASEEASLNEFRDFMAETRASKSEKSAMKQRKEMKKANQAQSLLNRKNDLKQLEEELDALHDYFKTLEPKCIKTDVSYAEEVKRREETMQALKDAYEMLNQY